MEGPVSQLYGDRVGVNNTGSLRLWRAGELIEPHEGLRVVFTLFVEQEVRRLLALLFKIQRRAAQLRLEAGRRPRLPIDSQVRKAGTDVTGDDFARLLAAEWT